MPTELSVEYHDRGHHITDKNINQGGTICKLHMSAVFQMGICRRKKWSIATTVLICTYQISQSSASYNTLGKYYLLLLNRLKVVHT